MIDSKDPPRWLEASEPGLRDVMRAAEGDVGSEEQMARLAARLGPVLAPPAAIATGSSALGTGTAAKVGLSALLLLVAGAGAWWLATKPPPPPSPGASPAPDPLSIAAPAPLPVAPSVVAPIPSEAAAVVPSAARAAPGPASKPAAPALPTEAEILEQARGALRTDPARALSRANQHAARYPGGALVQEREVIAIKALRALGRNAEAERRAESFAKAYPGSAFGRKLKATP